MYNEEATARRGEGLRVRTLNLLRRRHLGRVVQLGARDIACIELVEDLHTRREVSVVHTNVIR